MSLSGLKTGTKTAVIAEDKRSPAQRHNWMSQMVRHHHFPKQSLLEHLVYFSYKLLELSIGAVVPTPMETAPADRPVNEIAKPIATVEVGLKSKISKKTYKLEFSLRMVDIVRRFQLRDQSYLSCCCKVEGACKPE